MFGNIGAALRLPRFPVATFGIVIGMSVGAAAAAQAQAKAPVKGPAKAAAQAPAQAPAHEDEAPHKGDIVEVANHHVEFKAEAAGTIHVWLLDENHKTLAPPAGSKITLTNGAKQMTMLLEIDKASHGLTAKFDPKAYPAFQAIVSIPIKGSPNNVRFTYPSRH